MKIALASPGDPTTPPNSSAMLGYVLYRTISASRVLYSSIL